MKISTSSLRGLLSLLIAILPLLTFGQLSVSNNLSVNATLQQLFGAGVTISNVTVQGDTANAFGTFDGTMSNIGLDSGLIIATGNITNAQPGQFVGTNLGFPGDPQLSSIVGFGTFDAFSIEFDIASTCDTIAIQYVFGSKEYPTFVGSSFNDVFAFFISGHAYTTPTNIALVPGTNTPVSINNVNAGTNSNYYVANSGTTVGYGGFTVPLVAYAQVIPDSTYHVKLSIADVADAVFDSGVFLKRQGVCGNPGIVAITSNTTGFPNANANSITLDEGSSQNITFQHALDVDVNKTIYFQINGSASNGADFVLIPDSLTFAAGTNEVILPIDIIADCNLEGPEMIELVYTDSSITCDGSIYTNTMEIFINNVGGIESFDLGADQTICSGDTLFGVDVGLSGYTYAWKALGNSNIAISDSTIANPLFSGQNMTSTSQTNQVEVSVSNGAGCVKKDTITIIVEAQPEAAFTVDLTACVGDSISFTDNSSGFVDEWIWDFGQNNATSIQQDPTFAYDSAGTFIVSLMVKDGDCSSSISEMIDIYPAIEYAAPAWPDSLCTGDSVVLDISGSGYTSLSWDNGDGGTSVEPSFQILYADSGSYTISLSLINDGCEELVEWNIVAYACESANSIAELKPGLIKVYPNPATDNINIELEKRLTGELIISDIRGQIMQRRSISDTRNTVNTQSWAEGIYFFTIKTNEGMHREKILVRQ
jgi:PKD repeat protein